MKRILVLALIGIMVFSMTAWGAEAETTEADSGMVLPMASVDISPMGLIMFDAILEAAMDVDLEGKRAAGTEFPEDGNVFSLLEDVMAEIFEISSEDGSEDEETLSQLIYGLSSLGEEDEISEAELDDLLGLMLLATAAENVEIEPEDVDLSSYSVIGYDITVLLIEAVKDNKVIADAVEATDSSLFEILDSFIDDDKENQDARDALFEELEVELEKVTDHINTLEGSKGAALDLLNLIHTIADELHAYYYGHTHEIAEEAE